MSKKQKQLKLFENSESEEECTLKTNSAYAKHYDEFRKKEILSHLKTISDEDDSSDDASTDEELVNPEFDKEFLKSLAFLKNKDPNKYTSIPTFFENVPTVEETVKEKQQKKGNKPLTVAEYQRERLIKTEGRMSEDESADEEHPNNNSLSYVAEQEKIKNDLKRAMEDSSDDEGMFKIREKPKEEVEKEEEDYLKWIADQKKDVKLGKDEKALKPLKDFWTSDKLSKADQFLKDYIVNKRFMDKGDVPSYDDMIGLSEDEEEVEKQAEFETKYNFRFEQPDNDFIKRFPRNIEDTVRAPDNSRKEKRKERQERKAQEKEMKMKELRELQNIKKREIEEKLMLLKEVAGNEDFSLAEEDLNSDFDPDEHDRRMTKMFDNEYYGIDEGDKKPEFPDIDEELKIENWDNFDKSKIPDLPQDDEDQVAHCEDDDFIMDCDYNPENEKKKKIQEELIEMSKGRKRRKKISKLAELIKKEKPAYDPSTMDKTYEEYLDEYYKLDYEDIIADQPCRFRYTECVPNDFGLTVEEILLASNKELNQWASLKKTMQNRPKNVEINDVEKYNRRRNNLQLKKKIFASIYGQPESDKSEDSDDDSKVLKAENETEATQTLDDSKEVNESKVDEGNKKKKKNKRKKKGSNQDVKPPTKQSVNTKVSVKANGFKNKVDAQPKSSGISSTSTSNKRKMTDEIESATKAPQRFKKQKLHNQTGKQKSTNNKQASEFNELSENRLKAFGINPKKFKNKLKYGKNQQMDQGKSHKFNYKKKVQK
ncbi:CLUMA_CG009464, isoform A [Clunio marinus]|uniref:Protein KRI1 homolog n=1 Tax=Clunio marinus TaxID=568069 RepID=A0A1J1I6Z0_9DIPT|nr:CLUMA_CG009464, isoform A [Clunio marinus]